LMPGAIFRLIRLFFSYIRLKYLKWGGGKSLRLVIGSGGSSYAGWIPTDIRILNICSERDWEGLFRPASVARILSEHVFEHLSAEQCRMSFMLCHRFLQDGGVLRIAVPDGYRPDSKYLQEISPPKDGHQQLLTIDSLTLLLEEAGFEVRPLEYFDKHGDFHAVEWDADDGMICRSKRFDRQIDFKYNDLYYTSIIVDAVKPAQAMKK